MSFFDDIGLRAAEQLEASVGPYVALASYKRLFAGPPEIRDKAAFGALRCAIALDDDREIAQAASVWQRAESAPSSATEFVSHLLKRNKPGLAYDVAAAEEKRAPTLLASYLKLRAAEAAEVMPPASLADGWRTLAERARAANDQRILTHAAARFIGHALAIAARDPAAQLDRAVLADLAEASSIEQASVIERLVLLRARLLSPSRFHRAGALSALEDIAKRSDGPIRTAAIGIAARHFLMLFARLDAVEIDRIGATLKHHPDERARNAVIAQLPGWVRLLAATKSSADDRAARIEQAVTALSERSASVARGLALWSASADGAPASRPLGGAAEEALAYAGVDASAALDRDDPDAAVRAFEHSCGLLGPDVPVPPGLWSSAHRALLRARGPARRAAAEFIDRALCRTFSMPPQPLVDIALALSRAGHSAASARALAEAARWKEPGAEALLADEKRRAGYAAFARADRAASLALLREARALYAGQRP